MTNWTDGTPTTSATTRGYTDHEMDTDSGLVNMNARLYDAKLGQFLQADLVVPDPLNAQALNRYSYVVNNPFGYTDPTGHEYVGDIGDNAFYTTETGDPGPVFNRTTGTYSMPDGTIISSSGTISAAANPTWAIAWSDWNNGGSNNAIQYANGVGENMNQIPAPPLPTMFADNKYRGSSIDGRDSNYKDQDIVSLGSTRSNYCHSSDTACAFQANYPLRLASDCGQQVNCHDEQYLYTGTRTAFAKSVDEFANRYGADFRDVVKTLGRSSIPIDAINEGLIVYVSEQTDVFQPIVRVQGTLMAWKIDLSTGQAVDGTLGMGPFPVWVRNGGPVSYGGTVVDYGTVPRWQVPLSYKFEPNEYVWGNWRH